MADDQAHQFTADEPAIELKRVGQTALTTGKFRRPDGSEVVMLIILRDDILQIATFLSVDQASALAEDLLRTATELRTGLVVPPAGRIHTG